MSPAEKKHTCIWFVLAHSLASMEASRASNMKITINGGSIIGTMNGANVEINQEIGEKNMFFFCI